MLGRKFSGVVLRSLHSATGGASEWRPPLAWCVEASPESLVTTGGRLQLPERGRLDPGTLGDSCALRRRVTTPGPAAGANCLKAGARAGDRLRQQLKGSLPPHHRARALQQEYRMTHCGMPHCDMPQLHRFPPDTIVNPVACEDAVSTVPDLS